MAKKQAIRASVRICAREDKPRKQEAWKEGEAEWKTLKSIASWLRREHEKGQLRES